MKLDEEMNQRALGAEHLVDREEPKQKKCGECPLYVGGCDGYVHADNLCGDNSETKFGDVIPYAVSAIKNAIQPSDGGEFEKIVRFGDYLLENINSSYPKIGRLYRQLKGAHAADRAADRERIAELEQELADQKEVYGCTVGELKEEIERYASMYVSLKGIDACQQKRIAALEAEIAKLKQPSEELKSLFDSSLPTMHTNKKGQQVWTPDECKQVTRITELMKAVAARESAMKAEIERLKAENEMFRKVGDYLSSPLNCVLDTIKRKIRYHQLSEKRERALKDEIAQLKADKAMLLDASNHVLDEIWDSCDCFTEAQQALHNLIAKHTEANHD